MTRFQAILSAACFVILVPLLQLAQDRSAPATGIFLEQPGGATKPIARTTVLTQGLSKPQGIVWQPGVTADVVVTGAQPTFLFRCVPAANPKEFALARMAVDGDALVLDTAHLQTLKFDVEPRMPGVFHVRVATRLEPGEYAFLLADRPHGSGVPVHVWAFSYLGPQ